MAITLCNPALWTSITIIMADTPVKGIITLRKRVRELSAALAQGTSVDTAVNVFRVAVSKLLKQWNITPSQELLQRVPVDSIDSADSWTAVVAEMNDVQELTALLYQYIYDMRHQRRIRCATAEQRAVITLMVGRLVAMTVTSSSQKSRKKPLDTDSQQSSRSMVHELLSKGGFTQSSLAKELGVSGNTVSRWISGVNAVSPAYAVLIEALYQKRVIGIPDDELLRQLRERCASSEQFKARVVREVLGL